VQFNARSETIAEKGVFSKLIAGQRCVVFVNSFYEWKKVGTYPHTPAFSTSLACYVWVGSLAFCFQPFHWRTQ